MIIFFFFQAEDGIRDATVTGVQTCALPIWASSESWDDSVSCDLPWAVRVALVCWMKQASVPAASAPWRGQEVARGGRDPACEDQDASTSSRTVRGLRRNTLRPKEEGTLQFVRSGLEVQVRRGGSHPPRPDPPEAQRQEDG